MSQKTLIRTLWVVAGFLAGLGALPDVLPGVLPGVSTAWAEPGDRAGEHAADPARLDTDGVAELEDLHILLRRFDVAAQAHDERMVQTMARSGTAHYREITDQALAGTGLARRAIIARLEAYVARAPAQGKTAPRAMMLLADFYRSAGDDMGAQDNDSAEIDSAASGAQTDGAAAAGDNRVEHGLAAAMSLWERIAREFASSPYAAQALAELAQARFDMGDYELAKEAYQRLVCGNRGGELAVAQEAKGWAEDELSVRIYTNSVRVADYDGCVAISDDSALVEAAWMRLGSLHRSTYGEDELAISAFSQIAGNPRSSVYMTALQELASAYVDAEKLIEAIPVLDDLVMHLDRGRARRGNAPRDPFVDPLIIEMRAQSVARIGHILALLWRQSAIPDPDAARKLAAIYYSRGRRHQAHVRDVFDALGEALRDYGAFEQAVPVWRHVLDLWPLDPDAALVHDKLVKLLGAKGDTRAADRERRRLVERFGPDAAWLAANKDNAPALARARTVVERNLHDLAASQYRQATIAFENMNRNASKSYATATLSPNVRALYSDARASIERFIGEYPDSKHTYEMQYLRARVLYYNRAWLNAARAFAAVKARGKDLRYYEEAIRYMMFAYADELGERMRSGALAWPSMPGDAALAGNPAPLAVPDFYDELIDAYDAYEQVVTSQLQAAMVAVDAAQLELRYLRLDQAERRFAAIVDEYCHTYLAKEAQRQLAVLYRVRGNSEAARALDASFASQGCGDSRPARMDRRFFVSRQFRRGEELEAAGKHLEAARVFVEIYHQTTPSSEFHARALFAAARLFAEGGRHETALDLWREFDRRAELHASPLYAEAMWRKARAHERGFDSEAAVAAYLRVASLSQAKGYRSARSFDHAGAAAKSLWRAAQLLDEERIYYDRGASDPGAATLYLRHAAGQGKERAAQAHLAAARVYHKAGDTAALLRIYRDWRIRYGFTGDIARYHVHFLALIASSLESVGDRRGAARYYAELLDAHGKAGGKPGTAEAELAGQAQFWLAEDAYRSGLRSYRFEWPADGDRGARVVAAARTLERMAEKAHADFAAVHKYASSWSIAARVRQGDVWLDYANTLIDAPPPRWVSDLDAGHRRVTLERHADDITATVTPRLIQARAAWKAARDDAAARDVDNSWTRLAAQRLRAHGGSVTSERLLREEIVIRERIP